MSILIKQAKVILGNSGFDSKTVDILIEGGTIKDIRKTIQAAAGQKVIEAEGLCVSPGWIDMQVAACDPGLEHKEDLDSLVKCAAAGGFTAVCVHSYNQPALHNKAQIEYIVNKTRNKVVDVLPFGAITVDTKGKELAEMHDMKNSGAIAFSDYKHPIKESGMVVRALQYSANVGAFVVLHCNDESMAGGWQMNEGESATALGLKGIPTVAEELMVQRNLAILEYCGGKMHIPTITSRGSIELVKKAKAAGLNVTCGVAAANLYFDDQALKEFDTNLKLNPPLRARKDVQALRNAVESGVIDVIVSDHLPQDTESKELEFDLADFGMINLQTAFASACEAMKERGTEAVVKALTQNPRSILGWAQPVIEPGAEANLTLFVPGGQTLLTEKNNHSKSANTPFLGKSLKGAVVGIINGSKSYFN